MGFMKQPQLNFEGQKMKTTPLHEIHVKLKAKMSEFAGFSMPILYNGIIAEHEAVRQRAGIFDVSHMGNFFISGPGACKFLDRLCTGNIQGLKEKTALYTLICNAQGCPLDDLIVYRLAPDSFKIVANASNIQKDFNWLSQNCPQDVCLQDKSDAYAILALQGPLAIAIFSHVMDRDISGMSSFAVEEFSCNCGQGYFARTGYTGEDGVEIFIPNADTELMWNRIFERGCSYGLVPAGLGARDTLRLEMGYSLYGHELNEEINALEAGLAWVVDFQKDSFIGKDALTNIRERGLVRKLVGLEMVNKVVPRSGYTVFSVHGQPIGSVTSGTLSPSMGKGIALAYVQNDSAKLGLEVHVDIRGHRQTAIVVGRKFYSRPQRNSCV